MKKTIAVDIDDVLAISAGAFIKFGNDKWGTNLQVDDYQEDWALMWQVDRATERQRALEIYDAEVFKWLELRHPTVEQILRELSLKYDLVIATSRVRHVQQDTLEWLDKHFKGIFKDVHMAGIYDTIVDEPLEQKGAHHLTKGDLIKRIGADYLIDDQPKHCLAVAELGIETILFGDYGWNRDIGELPPRVTRCVDWDEVKKYFDERD